MEQAEARRQEERGGQGCSRGSRTKDSQGLTGQVGTFTPKAAGATESSFPRGEGLLKRPTEPFAGVCRALTRAVPGEGEPVKARESWGVRVSSGTGPGGPQASRCVLRPGLSASPPPTQAEAPLGAAAPGLTASRGSAPWGAATVSAPAKPLPPGWQGHELAVHRHSWAPTGRQARATEARRRAHLAMANRTRSKNSRALCSAAWPGAARERAGGEDHGGGKATEGAFYLGGAT